MYHLYPKYKKMNNRTLSHCVKPINISNPFAFVFLKKYRNRPNLIIFLFAESYFVHKSLNPLFLFLEHTHTHTHTHKVKPDYTLYK